MKNKKLQLAVEQAAGEISLVTSSLEASFNKLYAAAAISNKGFLPPAIREGYPKAIEALDALFAALSNTQ